MQKFDYDGILDLLALGTGQWTKPLLRELLAGCVEFKRLRGAHQLLVRLERKGFLQRRGRGERATFTIIASGALKRRDPDPQTSWERTWDGAWRLVTFDIPEVRRKDRARLWRALRDRKLGLLQRSVWIWPHDLKPILAEIIKAEGIPECFCGFGARELFLCTNAEVVETAWDFEEISHRQVAYQLNSAATIGSLNRSTNLSTLAGVARAERHAYRYAFSLDPSLPQPLWPKGYRGAAVLKAHREFRRRLQEQLRKLVTK